MSKIIRAPRMAQRQMGCTRKSARILHVSAHIWPSMEIDLLVGSIGRFTAGPCRAMRDVASHRHPSWLVRTPRSACHRYQ